MNINLRGYVYDDSSYRLIVAEDVRNTITINQSKGSEFPVIVIKCITDKNVAGNNKEATIELSNISPSLSVGLAKILLEYNEIRESHSNKK